MIYHIHSTHAHAPNNRARLWDRCSGFGGRHGAGPIPRITTATAGEGRAAERSLPALRAVLPLAAPAPFARREGRLLRSRGVVERRARVGPGGRERGGVVEYLEEPS